MDLTDELIELERRMSDLQAQSDRLMAELERLNAEARGLRAGHHLPAPEAAAEKPLSDG
jgi:hypothetical protein